MASDEASASETLDAKRQKLRTYRVGDLARLKFDDASPGEMESIRLNIAVFGMTGSGKSALINTIFKVLLNNMSAGSAAEQSFGAEGTTHFESFPLPDAHISIFDTRGFMDIGAIEEGELFRIVYGLTRSGEELDRGAVGARLAAGAGQGAHRVEKPPIADQMHAVLWVIKGTDSRFQQGKYSEKINFIRNQLHVYAFKVITVVTFDDEILGTKGYPEEFQKKALEVTGSHKSDVFMIGNWINACRQYNEDYKARVLEMLERALRCGELRIRAEQTRRKISEKDRTRSQPKRPVENTEPPGDYWKEK